LYSRLRLVITVFFSLAFRPTAAVIVVAISSIEFTGKLKATFTTALILEIN
jgi:hypothetical protein